jgi:hypothetical protein
MIGGGAGARSGRRIVAEGVRLSAVGEGGVAAAVARLGRGAVETALARAIVDAARRDGSGALTPDEARGAARAVLTRALREAERLER